MQSDSNSTTDALATDEPAGYADDTHVMRYLLHTIKGISPVSGGVLGGSLEQEYATIENDFSSQDS